MGDACPHAVAVKSHEPHRGAGADCFWDGSGSCKRERGSRVESQMSLIEAIIAFASPSATPAPGAGGLRTPPQHLAPGLGGPGPYFGTRCLRALTAHVSVVASVVTRRKKSRNRKSVEKESPTPDPIFSFRIRRAGVIPPRRSQPPLAKLCCVVSSSTCLLDAPALQRSARRVAWEKRELWKRFTPSSV